MSVISAVSAIGASRGDGGAGRGREWLTLPGRKRVLVVAHTLTFARRLREAFSLLESDFRVQVVFTAPPHEFGDGVARYLRRLGSAVLPWEEAVRMSFDLALAAGSRHVERVRAPLITMAHGASYLKLVPAPPRPNAGLNPGPDTGLAGDPAADPAAGSTTGSTPLVAGLSREYFVADGRVVPAAVAVPHRDDLAALARSCPEVLPVAHVVGDPVHDRIRASLPLRDAYRRALGLREGQKLIAVASTWGPRSSFGGFEALLPRLLGELRPPEHRVAVLVHPNVWSGHGPWQVRAWLARCGPSGIGLVPPEADWRSVLIAADWIIGDHGSVTLYGTLTGAPILLAASPQQEINPASPAAALAATAPALSPAHPLVSQLEYARAEYRREDYEAIAARITSEPGGFNRNMRALMYRLLGLGQPAHAPTTRPLPEPPPLDTWTGTDAEATA
ncbi:hypothetical protein ABT174_19075 [Streptomyces sparsogenes]|uniref:hypothetical protein n=1 Tax=Streptomyces sparsogenes TaxID=67365 RepID=UPI00332D06C1